MSTQTTRIQRGLSRGRRGRSMRWTADLARAELDAWRQSGMTMAAFCRARGINVRRFYNWRTRLKKWVGGDRDGDAMLPERQKSVRWIEATVGRAIVGTETAPALTLRLGDGGCIEVAAPDRVDARWLARLVRGLSETALR